MFKKILFLSVCFVMLTIQKNEAQNTLNTSGGKASNVNTGSVSYSVGQLITTSTSNSNGSVTAGVQQAFEISTTLGIEDTTINLEYTAYPNPTVDILHLSINNFNQENLRYQLFNVQGQLLASKKISNTTTIIGMEGYAASIYFLKVVTNNQPIKTFKIVKN